MGTRHIFMTRGRSVTRQLRRHTHETRTRWRLSQVAGPASAKRLRRFLREKARRSRSPADGRTSWSALSERLSGKADRPCAPGSVTNEQDVQEAVAATVRTFGRLDILVNNAGNLFHAGRLHETTDQIWDETLTCS